MWIKLARHRYWIAFCVIITAVFLLRDMGCFIPRDRDVPALPVVQRTHPPTPADVSANFDYPPYQDGNHREPVSATDKKLWSKGIYPVPIAYRDRLHRMQTGRCNASAPPLTRGTVLVDAEVFPTAASVHPVRNAVIVAKGTPVYSPKPDSPATFTVYIPSYIAGSNLRIHAYNATGRMNAYEYGGTFKTVVNAKYATYKTLTIPDAHQSDIYGVTIAVR